MDGLNIEKTCHDQYIPLEGAPAFVMDSDCTWLSAAERSMFQHCCTGTFWLYKFISMLHPQSGQSRHVMHRGRCHHPVTSSFKALAHHGTELQVRITSKGQNTDTHHHIQYINIQFVVLVTLNLGNILKSVSLTGVEERFIKHVHANCLV